jgi:hypothetical protein
MPDVDLDLLIEVDRALASERAGSGHVAALRHDHGLFSEFVCSCARPARRRRFTVIPRADQLAYRNQNMSRVNSWFIDGIGALVEGGRVLAGRGNHRFGAMGRRNAPPSDHIHRMRRMATRDVHGFGVERLEDRML